MSLPSTNLNLAQNVSSGADGKLVTAPINFKSSPVESGGVNWTFVIVAALVVAALVVFKKKG